MWTLLNRLLQMVSENFFKFEKLLQLIVDRLLLEYQELTTGCFNFSFMVIFVDYNDHTCVAISYERLVLN